MYTHTLPFPIPCPPRPADGPRPHDGGGGPSRFGRHTPQAPRTASGPNGGTGPIPPCKALGPVYNEFGETPFAKFGGLPGTTARLVDWFRTCTQGYTRY